MTAAAYSDDGSVIAIGCRNIVTLWLPETNTRDAILPSPACPDTSTATHVAFLQDSYFLVSAHSGKDGCICVWNLLSYETHWCIYAAITDIAAHPTLPRFTTVTHQAEQDNSVVATLGPGSDVAEGTWVSPKGMHISRCLYAGPGTALQSQMCTRGEVASDGGVLFVITTGRRIITLPDVCTEENEDDKEESECLDAEEQAGEAEVDEELEKITVRPEDVFAERAEATAEPSADANNDASAELQQQQPAQQGAIGFEALFGEAPGARGATAAPAAAAAPSAVDLSRLDGVSAVFDAPSHLLAPASDICEGVLKMMLRKPQEPG